MANNRSSFEKVKSVFHGKWGELRALYGSERVKKLRTYTGVCGGSFVVIGGAWSTVDKLKHWIGHPSTDKKVDDTDKKVDDILLGIRDLSHQISAYLEAEDAAARTAAAANFRKD
ncbi:hypothetical protein ACET3Z_015378 [Daucus carota]